MKITLKQVSVRDLTTGYTDNQEGGVTGYDGRLDIRPPFQREFVYKDTQRDAVIETINKNFPLNVMYWALKDDGGFEIIDGQQRTISICQYVTGDFSIGGKYFHNLQPEEQEKLLDYEVTVYLCSGDAREKLEWFQIVNIAGEKLEAQELRNAVYAGSWVTDAKRFFSRRDGPAENIAGKYLQGSAVRQKYLETTLKWISKGDIRDYMARHQHEPNAHELWQYFNEVFTWVKLIFPRYRKEMKAVAWGDLYNQYGHDKLDSRTLEDQVRELMMDDEVTKKSGIYSYLLTGQEKYLNLRTFTESQKREAYEAQAGICPQCHQRFAIEEMEADHITPWYTGGRTNPVNCQMLCKHDNRVKSGK